MVSQYDLTIIGAGIVGLATALRVTQTHPGTRLLVLDKESQIAQHQTGHNSGVIHSGLYYRPGSVKAATCVTGRKALLEFCDRNGVPYEICGKTVVATSQDEVPRLEELHRRGLANGLKGIEALEPERLKEFEPHATGVKGLHVAETGIIDYRKVAEAYARNIRASGGDIRTSHRVIAMLQRDGETVLQTSGGDYRTRHVINCGGLQSDLIANMLHTEDSETQEAHQIIPFRGEYYKLA
ncbi:MAG: FAD-dependent oxidoreductase, partial [Deltaproteobacteria bacterium]